MGHLGHISDIYRTFRTYGVTVQLLEAELLPYGLRLELAHKWLNWLTVASEVEA